MADSSPHESHRGGFGAYVAWRRRSNSGFSLILVLILLAESCKDVDMWLANSL